jgi:hypothetical protein
VRASLERMRERERHLNSRRREVTIADGVETSFLACDHNVRYRLAVLPSFWGAFDVSIPVKHL